MLTQFLNGKWQFRQILTGEWLPATVPGGVHTDLLALGKIPDPFVADNENKVRWVAETDWEYWLTVTVNEELLTQEKLFLVCNGLDTLAEVTLNGTLLGKTDNMYRQYRWNVKSLLKPGENEFVIIFRSPVQYITACEVERPMLGVSHAIAGGPHLRKAPCHFGWDWGPKLPPIGIWQDIWLEGGSVARLDDVHLRQQHAEGQVDLRAEVSVEKWADTPLTATLTVTDPNGASTKSEAAISGSDGTLEIGIEQPQLWWPNGYPSSALRAGGDQPLYQVEVAVMADDQLCDSRTYQIGLRTIELRQDDDEWGKSFTFVVNDVPIFAKGSNWIPADSFPTRLSDDHLERLIRDAAAAHQNMLRVWGGGLYEEERFYDLCDKYGILVWQDFIFSCSIYPMDKSDFLETVYPEVVENIRRLRHRASLALWCGNNEMEWGWDEWGWDLPNVEAAKEAIARFPQLAGLSPAQVYSLSRQMKQAYHKFFHVLLPQWCARENPDTVYWPSSPSTDIPFDSPNGQWFGDAHYWDVWHGRKPFTAYRDQYPRFMSEFGFQSLPPMDTIRTYADEADWNMTSYIMEHHQKNDAGNGLIIGQMTETFRMPKDFPSLVYLSMLLQAEGIRYGVEHWRRNMQRVSGTLYWQLNDCWPVASWASLDYYGRWKALHYASRRFYAPLMLSIEDSPPQMGLHITSDLTESWEGTVRWSLETLGGDTLKGGQETVTAGPLQSTPISILDFADLLTEENRRDLIFVAALWQGEKRVSLGVSPFVQNKHLLLIEPGLNVAVSQQDNQLVFAVSAKSLARFVELSLEGVDVVFSDNYFDVPAGRTVSVSCPLPEGWTVEQAQTVVTVQSLYNSFA